MSTKNGNSGAAAETSRAYTVIIRRGLDIVAFALGLPYRIVQHYLGELEEDITLSELDALARLGGGDFALELKGEKLHLFRVIVREVS